MVPVILPDGIDDFLEKKANAEVVVVPAKMLREDGTTEKVYVQEIRKKDDAPKKSYASLIFLGLGVLAFGLSIWANWKTIKRN